MQGEQKTPVYLHPLEQRVGKTIRNRALLPEGSRLLIGVSGGPDSIALLHILAALRNEFSLTLVVAYVDHGLRPEETPAEWVHVQKVAKDLAVETVRMAVDVNAVATRRKLSLEHAAREMRYQAFAEVAQKWNTDWLAVAHTADDQVEEVLLRLFRGGGRKALSGMRYRVGNLIRPLLGICKVELLAYLADKKSTACYDSSNDDCRFLRNRIRLELLPLLEAQYDSGIRQALLKTAANLAEDEDLLELLLAEAWEQVVQTVQAEGTEGTTWHLHRDSFCHLHPALQRRLIEKLLWSIGAIARYEQILAILDAARCGRTGSELHLSQGLRVAVDRTCLEFSYPLGKGPWRGRLGSR